ncbi:MAG TPA: PQQ-dependent sugar dehydrogenase, partial [Lacipirellulaceae bacterium]|nr:PQQ-dependent sugar dehydrogenase [Lacipirellulaceae bacterium]
MTFHGSARRPYPACRGGLPLGISFAAETACVTRRIPHSLRAAIAAACCWLMLGSAGVAQVTGLRIADYATMPMTGSTQFPSDTANSAYLARVNFLADEPGGGSRFFVNDLNGPLYILDKRTKQFSTYLNFNGRGAGTGLFDKFVFSSGFANGLITFQFDPDHANNGKFYTVHMEQPSASGSLLPNNSSVPGFNTAGYTTTPAVTTPGGGARQTVLIQWTDTNIANNTFEGTARELLRVEMSGQIHPMGDLIFNPLAGPGDPDWRVMYISIGDGGAGEQSATTQLPVRMTPQRLDVLGGKILRIIPDLDEHTDTSTVSPNGRYRIPNDNPYTSIDDSRVRDELFAVGLRNPHRMSWDVDPSDPANNHLIADDIGLHTWEEVNIIQPGRNFGYSQREGNEVLQSNNSTTSLLPRPDVVPVQITDTVTAGTIVPTYPVAQYGHDFSDSQFIGDSISSGYVYRGSRIPELYGKYIFGEITTGQIFYCELDEMLAADDGDPATMAEIHSLSILW